MEGPTASDSILAIALSSTVIIFLVISIIIFIVGFICGHCHGRNFNRSSARASRAHSTADQPCQIPLYEDVVNVHVLSSAEQDFELRENVAYGPSRSIITKNQ